MQQKIIEVFGCISISHYCRNKCIICYPYFIIYIMNRTTIKPYTSDYDIYSIYIVRFIISCDSVSSINWVFAYSIVSNFNSIT